MYDDAHMCLLFRRGEPGFRRDTHGDHPMKVCHIITRMGTGGAQLMMLKLLERMDRGQYDQPL